MEPLHISRGGAVALLDLAYSLGMQGGSGSVGGERFPPYRIQAEAVKIGATNPIEIGAEYRRQLIPVLACPRVVGRWHHEIEYQIKG
jgi:hypothetical protein